MQWSFPAAFLLLLGAVPIILLLNSLRPRGPRVRISALFLLEKVLRERPIGKRLGWLWHRNLPLILQLLAALALVTALADPGLLGLGRAGRNVVAVVDLSASMKARGESESRFDQARARLGSLIGEVAGDGRMMIIGAGAEPRVLQPFTADKAQLRRAVAEMAPTDGAAPVQEAVLLAHSFLGEDGSDRLVVITDGAFPDADALPWDAPYLELEQVVGGSDNVAIVGFQLRRITGKVREYEIMVALRNYTERSVRAPLIITIADQIVKRALVTLRPFAREVFVYPYQGDLRGRATALIAVQDDFSTDDRAYLAFPDARPTRLLYVGGGNPFLDRLFRYLPRVTVARMDRLPLDELPEQITAYDVVVVDGVPAPRLSRGNFVLINTVPEGLPLRVRGRSERPPVTGTAGQESLGSGLELTGLYVKEALALVPTGDGTIVADSPQGPLIYAAEEEGLKALVFAFALEQSDLPFRVAFPLLMRNALAWFRPQPFEFPAMQVAAGAPFTAPSRGGGGALEFRKPSGSTVTLPAEGREVIFDDTSEVGFYSFTGRQQQGEFAVNLFSEQESQIRPSPGALAGGQSASRASMPQIATVLSLWPALLAIVLAVLAFESFVAYRSRPSLYPLVLRLPALAAVVLALVNPSVFHRTNELDVVVGVDLSDSVGRATAAPALRILERSQAFLNPRVRLGVFSFAERPQWEFPPVAELPAFDLSQPDGRHATSLAAALQGALGELSDTREGRVLLVSDGNENKGNARGLAGLLRSHRVQVWSYPVSLSDQTGEVYLSDLVLPARVNSGDTFEVKAALESVQVSSTRVKLIRNGRIVADRQTTLNPGTNWVIFTERLNDHGNFTYEVLLEAPEDALPENNLLQGIVDVKGPARVLYLRQAEDERRFMAEALRVQGYEVHEVTPEVANMALPELATFDLLVMDNVPAYRLSQARMERIEHFVRDLGGGLIVLGGPKSYGAGGYYRSPLERVLPVEMRPPVRLEMPHVALLFVVDKSGSMGGGPAGTTKLDLAKAATLASAELLNPTDELGVLAFDSDWQWIVPFRPASEAGAITDRIAGLKSDGGTNLHKALVEGRRELLGKAAAVKHVLVLSDGLTEKGDIVELVRQMAGGRVTVSTVSIGGDADMALMTRIAQAGKGRSYLTVDPRTIPQIFTTETLMISRELLVDKTVTPTVADASGAMRGLAAGPLPPVHGYVLTHPKPNAEVHLKAADDPLLVSWRYGLGRVHAYTSDISGAWGRDWVAWERFPQWVGQVARLTVKQVLQEEMRTQFVRTGETVKAFVDFFSPDGRPVNHLDLNGMLIGADETVREQNFHQVAPGRYEADFTAPPRGVNLLTLTRGQDAAGLGGSATVPFIVPYSKEYSEISANTPLLEQLARDTGGEMLNEETLEEGLERLFEPAQSGREFAQGTWWYLGVLGLCIFLADLAARTLAHRRFGF